MSWQPLPEPELVPYQALAPSALAPLVVLAPHADDEVFGCGGLLALAAGLGVPAAVAVVSDGAAGGDAALREAECREAARVIGYARDQDALQFWRMPDRGVVPDDALVARVAALLAERQPQWLLAPSPLEVHPDHRAVCLAAIAAAAGAPGVRLGFYEVSQPLLPDVLVDITPVLSTKRRAMACYASQLAVQRYDEQIDALNRYRAYTLGPTVTHAEALWFAHEATGVDAVLAALARQLRRRLGLAGQP